MPPRRKPVRKKKTRQAAGSKKRTVKELKVSSPAAYNAIRVFLSDSYEREMLAFYNAMTKKERERVANAFAIFLIKKRRFGSGRAVKEREALAEILGEIVERTGLNPFSEEIRREHF